MSNELFEKLYYDPSNPAAFGGISRLSKAANGKDPRKWLESQPTYTLHKPARKKGYPTRPYRTKGVDYHWQADLVEWDRGLRIIMLTDTF